jgi:hypothetical protein
MGVKSVGRWDGDLGGGAGEEGGGRVGEGAREKSRVRAKAKGGMTSLAERLEQFIRRERLSGPCIGNASSWLASPPRAPKRENPTGLSKSCLAVPSLGRLRSGLLAICGICSRHTCPRIIRWGLHSPDPDRRDKSSTSAFSRRFAALRCHRGGPGGSSPEPEAHVPSLQPSIKVQYNRGPQH